MSSLGWQCSAQIVSTSNHALLIRAVLMTAFHGRQCSAHTHASPFLYTALARIRCLKFTLLLLLLFFIVTWLAPTSSLHFFYTFPFTRLKCINFLVLELPCALLVLQRTAYLRGTIPSTLIAFSAVFVVIVCHCYLVGITVHNHLLLLCTACAFSPSQIL